MKELEEKLNNVLGYLTAMAFDKPELANILDQSLNELSEATELVNNFVLDNVSKSFEIGEKVLHKTTTEVFISDYCEDVEQIEVCCGADYYNVDIDSLVKI
jgi:hypothetical protein